jgi:hypothetical protein
VLAPDDPDWGHAVGYPDEMRETFARLMEEHGIHASTFLPADG